MNSAPGPGRTRPSRHSDGRVPHEARPFHDHQDSNRIGALRDLGPDPTLFRHFLEEARGQAGSVYGRQMYEVMRYWDDQHPEWDADERAFAAAWRNQPRWVVSRSLKSVGPNATLVEDDLEGSIRKLKAERDGEIEVAGPRPALRLATSDRIGDDVIRLAYVPA